MDGKDYAKEPALRRHAARSGFGTIARLHLGTEDRDGGRATCCVEESVQVNCEQGRQKSEEETVKGLKKNHAQSFPTSSKRTATETESVAVSQQNQLETSAQGSTRPFKFIQHFQDRSNKEKCCTTLLWLGFECCIFILDVDETVCKGLLLYKTMKLESAVRNDSFPSCHNLIQTNSRNQFLIPLY